MFKFLKEKLKSWTEKIKQEKPSEKTKESKKKTTKQPKSKTKTKKKPKSQKTKKIQLKQEFNPGTQKYESQPESIEEKLAQLQELENQQEINQKTEEKPVEQENTQEEPQEKTSFFNKFRKKLDENTFEEIFEELELILLQNNVAYEAIESIKLKLKKELIGKILKQTNLEESLKKAISSILENPPNTIQKIKSTLKTKTPYVIAFVGINGTGKTTSIAKFAYKLKKEKLSVCLAAADTFRAASIEQLTHHAEKLNIPIIKKDYNADPASVGYDAITYAKKHKIDVVLIDTAGRMNTKDSLMKEMEKIIRVNNPDMKIFVAESTTGNDAVEQARDFNNSINLTGIILTKTDVDEKGGTALSVTQVTNKPILFIGTGQEYKDLEEFNKDKIIKRLGL